MSRLTKAFRRLFGIKRRHHERAGAYIGKSGRGNLSDLRVTDYTPNFFVVGAARCGTTSLWEYLRQHPDIFMPPVIEQKEPAFFCNLYGVEPWDFYLTLFEAGKGKKRIGEASTAYLSAPESAGQIHSLLPHAKIIISLRNPVVRAYSLYKWMHANGYEKIATFAHAFEAETTWRKDNNDFKKNNGENYYNFLYYHSGLYYQQVKRYLTTFPADQVHLIIFEEFVKEPLQHVQQIFRFLGVDSSFVPRIEVNNPSAPHYPALDPALRGRLAKMYVSDIRKLEKLLSRNLRSLWI